MEKNEKTPVSWGRYFGICFSYHNSKACRCRACPSFPENGKLMFCAKGRSERLGKMAGCLCQECELYRKFKLEGAYFCF